MDVKDVTCGAILYLPVFVDRALFAAGDLHAIQADEEACVSAVEVSGKLTLSFDVLRGNCSMAFWKIRKAMQFWLWRFFNAACSLAVDEAVKALMREHNWSFEEAVYVCKPCCGFKDCGSEKGC
jgi:amidase